MYSLFSHTACVSCSVSAAQGLGMPAVLPAPQPATPPSTNLPHDSVAAMPPKKKEFYCDCVLQEALRRALEGGPSVNSTAQQATAVRGTKHRRTQHQEEPPVLAGSSGPGGSFNIPQTPAGEDSQAGGSVYVHDGEEFILLVHSAVLKNIDKDPLPFQDAEPEPSEIEPVEADRSESPPQTPGRIEVESIEEPEYGSHDKTGSLSKLSLEELKNAMAIIDLLKNATLEQSGLDPKVIEWMRDPGHDEDLPDLTAPENRELRLALKQFIELVIGLLRGNLKQSNPSPTDPVADWDWACLRDKDVWEAYGKLVAEASLYLPGSFDHLPRNPAEKISSSYKAWEFMYYFYGMLPGLLWSVQKPKYYFHFCKLVGGARVSLLLGTPVKFRPPAHNLLVEYVEEFEELYYQWRVLHALVHLIPENICVGPAWLHSQWPLENAIGNLTAEIGSHSKPYENLSLRGLRRVQISALVMMFPETLEDPEVLPRRAVDLGDRWVLMHPTARTAKLVPDINAIALHAYLTKKAVRVPEAWRPRLTKWGQLRLPNGQVARTAWKECEGERRGHPVHRSRMVTLKDNRFAEVQYFFRLKRMLEDGGTDDVDMTLAMVSLFMPLDAAILRNTYGVLMVCQYQGDASRKVIEHARDTEKPEELVLKSFQGERDIWGTGREAMAAVGKEDDVEGRLLVHPAERNVGKGREPIEGVRASLVAVDLRFRALVGPLSRERDRGMGGARIAGGSGRLFAGSPEMALALAEAGAQSVYCLDLPQMPGEELIWARCCWLKTGDVPWKVEGFSLEVCTGGTLSGSSEGGLPPAMRRGIWEKRMKVRGSERMQYGFIVLVRFVEKTGLARREQGKAQEAVRTLAPAEAPHLDTGDHSCRESELCGPLPWRMGETEKSRHLGRIVEDLQNTTIRKSLVRVNTIAKDIMGA
ncbi:hypothetical protein BD311DRAFT_742970 [Dichomitus squalens]|uniref:Uncharacterized protein n=1 Tax=Dichomitus squalens TaxID=114155 RepID=A0A4Q9M8K5_9APHY|nr:hypothetical protein BD311DRAFT_742970 [Dichomitus squalens]